MPADQTSNPEHRPLASGAASSNAPRTGRKTLFFTGAASLAVLALTAGQMATTEAETVGAEAAPMAAAVTVAAPLVAPINEWNEHTGRFVASQQVEVRSRVSGYLTETAFVDGTSVKKGDLLFRIDPRPFRAEVAAAQAELARAQASLSNARSESERGERLLERQALSTEDVERRNRQLLEAQADVAAARANLEAARLNLEFTEVRAPISGRISDDFVSEGNLVLGGAQGGAVLTTIMSIDPIQFEFTVSEADYLAFRAQQLGRAGLDGAQAAPAVYVRLMDEDAFATRGELSFMDNQLDRSTGTIRGRATFANPDGRLVPGMFGRLRIVASEEQEAVLIPDTAVQTDQTEKFVWVAGDGDTAERREVTLGPIVDGLRVVRGGLTGDERLVVAGTQFLQPGMPVNPADTGAVHFSNARTETTTRQ